MKKQWGFKKWAFNGPIMLLLAVVLAISGMSSIAMAAAGDVLVSNGSSAPAGSTIITTIHSDGTSTTMTNDAGSGNNNGIVGVGDVLGSQRAVIGNINYNSGINTGLEATYTHVTVGTSDLSGNFITGLTSDSTIVEVGTKDSLGNEYGFSADTSGNVAILGTTNTIAGTTNNIIGTTNMIKSDGTITNVVGVGDVLGGLDPQRSIIATINGTTNTAYGLGANGTGVAVGTTDATTGARLNGLSSDLTGVTVGAVGTGVEYGLSANTTGVEVGTRTTAGVFKEGLTVTDTQTTLSGGTTSTTLTLNDNGASLDNRLNMNGNTITGVADGKNQYDAVNFGQLQKANAGIASVSALAAIPGAMPGKRFAIGAGYGYFENESALAIGIKAAIGNNISISVGAGVGGGYSSSTVWTGNAGISYSF